MTDVVIGVRLVGGPPHFDGWVNGYEADALGGWPPPEELAVFSIGGVVVVALPQNVPDNFERDATMYRKIAQSVVTEAPTEESNFFRGATYEYMPTDE